MRVLVLSSFTKSLAWFRMELMEEIAALGHEVYAMGSQTEGLDEYGFCERGISYESFRVSRNGLNPIEDMRTYYDLKRSIRRIAPDRIFVYQAKTVVYGCLAAKACGIDAVFPLIAGLGSVFRGKGLRNRLVSSLLAIQYRAAFKRSKRVFFQNRDDCATLVGKGLLTEDKVVFINGSGVNLDRFRAVPMPAGTAFLFVGRLIRDKGVGEYLSACAEVRARHPDVRCMIVGPFDTNLSSIQPSELEHYVAMGVVEYFGDQSDVRPFMAESTVLVLPSYHEGTPKSVLEAMAMGRAVITTDAPGCRETVEDGRNGFLVPVRDVELLVERMERFVDDPGLAASMGVVGRRLVEEKYDVRDVNRVILGAMDLGSRLS